MGNINSDAGTLRQTLQDVKQAVSDIESSKRSLISRYQQLGAGWNDKKYESLGRIANDCVKALDSVQNTLVTAQRALSILAQSLTDYESTRIGSGDFGSYSGTYAGAVSGTVINGILTVSNPNGNNFSGRSLSQTAQQVNSIAFNGRDCTVFDSPFDPNPGRICNQGSAYPDGPQSTCGLCSSGSIINKAGGNVNERSMVNFAWNSQLCDDHGYTSADSITSLLTLSGVPASNTSGTSLDDLAGLVEQGRGVILGVDARRLDPDFYQRHGGHAIVLESIIRDAHTGEIEAFVVADSNRSSSVDAVRCISISRLERAFRAAGYQSITTDNIIW